MRYVFIIFLFLSSFAFAESGTEIKGEFKPAPETDMEADNMREALKNVKIGMTKEELHSTFGQHYRQRAYSKKDNEEWITYGSWMLQDTANQVIFYLKDGKVKGWEEEY